MILDDGLNAPDHTEEDENYFISMTDMMVGVLFIFLIMLMIFALNFKNITEEQIKQYERDSAALKKAEQALDVQRKQLADTRQQLDHVKSVADDVAKRLEELTKQVSGQLAEMQQASKVRSDLLNALRNELRVRGMDVEIDELNGVLRLTENAIRFPVNKSDLDATATENVDKVAMALGIVLPCYTHSLQIKGGTQCAANTSGTSVETVFIEGHTDATGGDDRNWPLSTDRAVKTYRELTAFAPALRQLANERGSEILSVSGYGSTRPIDDQINNEAYAKNRRIDLRFVMENDNSERLNQILQATEDMKKQLDQLHTSVEQVQ